jgi:hypothetical protein
VTKAVAAMALAARIFVNFITRSFPELRTGARTLNTATLPVDSSMALGSLSHYAGSMDILVLEE